MKHPLDVAKKKLEAMRTFRRDIRAAYEKLFEAFTPSDIINTKLWRTTIKLKRVASIEIGELEEQVDEESEDA